MTNWKPDTEFLDFLLKKMEKESSIGATAPFIGTPDGTQKGGQGYNMTEMVEAMREGKEKRWQRMYEAFYNIFRQDFETYKANKQ